MSSPPSPVRYEVSGEPPANVREELCRLWSTNLALGAGAAAHFRWLYEHALGPAETVFVLRAAGTDGPATMVGSVGFSPRTFQLGRGQLGRAAVAGDLVVDLAHRSLLPALRLVRALREGVAREFDVSYGLPNPKAEGVMLRAGFTRLGTMTRYARVLRHAPFLGTVAQRLAAPPWLAALVERPAVRRALSPLVDVSRLGLSAVRVAQAVAHYQLRFGTTFDDRFDELWARVRGDYEIVGARTAAFLRWRYPSCEVATLVRRADRALVAYAIVERDHATGAAYLRDVFGHRHALGALLDLLLPALYARGVASVSIRFLGAPQFTAELAARGFEARPETRTVVVQVGAARDAARAHLEDAGHWHLLDIDEDT